MNRRVALLAIGPAALAACFDFVGPESPAAYGVIVQFMDSTFTSTTIGAFLDPGYDADAHQRDIPNDAISVWNQTLSPLEINDEGVRRYETTLAIDPRSLGSPVITTVPPDVADVEAAPALSLNLVWREGPQSIDVPRGSEVVLKIANTEVVTDVDDRLFWRLSVLRSDGRTIFRASALGLPPATITIPGVVTADTTGAGLSALFETQYRTGSEAPCFTCPTYAATLQVTAQLHWKLVLVGS